MNKRIAVLFVLLIMCSAEVNALETYAQSSFVMTSVALYQTNDTLNERIGADIKPLSQYIKSIKAEAEKIFASASPADGATGSIVVAIKPGGLSRFWLVLGDNKLPDTLKESLLRGLSAIKPISVINGPVAVAVNFDVWGGGKPILGPDEMVAIPNEWRSAMQNQPAGVLPDAPLKIIWP